MTQGKERSNLKGKRRRLTRQKAEIVEIEREKQAEMPYFELWQCVKVSEKEKEKKMGRKKKRCQASAPPRGELVEASGEGTNESRGLRDNLWEGK